MGSFKKAINTSITVDLESKITMDAKIIFSLCNNKDEVLKLYLEQEKEYVSFLERYNRHGTFSFSRNLELGINKDSLEYEVRFSSIWIIASLYQLFFKSNSDYLKLGSEDFELFEKEVKKLSKIKDELELKKKYPNLYELYKEERKIYNENLKKYQIVNRRIKDVNNLNIKNTIINNNEYLKLKEYIDNYKENVPNFCQSRAFDIGLIMDNYDSIQKYIDEHPLNIDKYDIDEDKLKLYITRYYLRAIKNVDDEYKQNYIYYLKNYFFENSKLIEDNFEFDIDVNDYTNMNRKNLTLNIKEMYEEFKKILKENENLRLLDFKKEDFNGMKLEEIQEFLDEYVKDLKNNWKFFPDSKSLDEEIKKRIGNKELDTNANSNKDREKLLDLYISKKALFDSTDPFVRSLGINTFEGYVAYIYKNGIVILEKYYDSLKTKSLTSENAIYAMDIKEFYQLSNISKREIINNRLCQRVYHRGSWQEKVINLINNYCGEIPNNEIFKLMEMGKIDDPDKIFIRRK